MAIQTRYLCETGDDSYLYTFEEMDFVALCIKQNDIINSVHLSKYDILQLIEELNLALKNLD